MPGFMIVRSGDLPADTIDISVSGKLHSDFTSSTVFVECTYLCYLLYIILNRHFLLSSLFQALCWDYKFTHMQKIRNKQKNKTVEELRC